MNTQKLHRILYLDLEDTVIDDFQKGLFAQACNILKVSRKIKEFDPDEVRLFSFALSDEGDVQDFKRELQRWLEGILDIRFNMDDVFTTQKLELLCRKHHCFFEDEHECMLFHGKDYGFQRYIEMTPEHVNCHVLLIDDAVETKTLFYPGRNLTIEHQNVDELR